MASEMREPAWYLAQIKPNSRRIAEANLTRQGFEVFVPLERQTQRRQGGFITRLVPFFPGYLFVRQGAAAAAPFRAINATQGVTRLVSFGSEPAAVPDDIVASLRHQCDTDGCLTLSLPLALGDHVRVAEGPFANLVAQILTTPSDRRIWLLLDFMGNPTRITIDASFLRAV